MISTPSISDASERTEGIINEINIIRKVATGNCKQFRSASIRMVTAKVYSSSMASCTSRDQALMSLIDVIDVLLMLVRHCGKPATLGQLGTLP